MHIEWMTAFITLAIVLGPLILFIWGTVAAIRSYLKRKKLR